MSADTDASSALSSTGLRQAYGTFPTGVVALCAQRDANDVGMAMSTFVPVSLDPPLVAFCVQNSSTTWPVLRGQPYLGVSVLAQHQGAQARQLAGNSDRRFTDLGREFDGRGRIFINGAAAWLACTVSSEVPAGDHTIVLLKVEDFTIHEEVRPLVFHASGFGSVGSAEQLPAG